MSQRREFNQGLAVGSPISPPVHEHRVDLIAVTSHQLVPLAVKLRANRNLLFSILASRVV